MHFLSCLRLTRSAINRRHHMVVQALAAWIRRAGGSASIEPKNLSFLDGKRPDILVTLGTDHFLVDVTIRHPTAPSQVAIALVPLGIASQAERRKLDHYQDMARQQLATMVPFAIESYGAFGDLATSFMKRIADHARHSSPSYSVVSILSGLIQSLAVAVQRGNTEAIAHGLRLSLPGRPQSFRPLRPGRANAN